MIIPWRSLAIDTLRSLLEDYATRDGTDYGHKEISLDQKVAQLTEQLHAGIIVIEYSELHETVTLRLAEDVIGHTEKDWLDCD